MKANIDSIPAVLQIQGVVIRSTDWGPMNVEVDTFPKGTDSGPVSIGLPDDRCQCPHWGYVIEGSMLVHYADREERYVTGDAFYMEPGHTAYYEEDTRLIEFSPVQEHHQTAEVMAKNVAAMMAAHA